jgi:tetratricopeptide (TPR) repeat protein
MNDLNTKLDECNNEIALDPNNASAYDKRCDVYLDMGDFTSALTDCNKTIELEPNNADYYNARGWVYYYKIKQVDAAISDYSKAISLNSQKSKYYNNRGLAYLNIGKFDEAIEDFSKGISLDQNVNCYRNRGLAYSILQQHEASLSDFEKAIEINSDNADYFSGRGGAYSGLKKYDKALVDFNKAISLAPDNSIYYMERGNVFRDMEKYDEAIMDYNKGIELAPEDAGYYSIRCDAYLQIKQYDAAIADFKKIIMLEPTALVYYSLGHAYYQKSKAYLLQTGKDDENYFNDFQKAINNIESAVKEDRTNNDNFKKSLELMKSEFEDRKKIQKYSETIKTTFGGEISKKIGCKCANCGHEYQGTMGCHTCPSCATTNFHDAMRFKCGSCKHEYWVDGDSTCPKCRSYGSPCGLYGEDEDEERKERERKERERLERERKEREEREQKERIEREERERIEREKKEAFNKLITSAEQGDANAQYELGRKYFLGEGALQNYKEATEWFNKSARQGNVNAAIFITRNSNIKDDVKAEDLIKKAAKQGNEEAKNYLVKKKQGIKEYNKIKRRELSARFSLFFQICFSIFFLFILWGTDIVKTLWLAEPFFRLLPLAIFSIVVSIFSIIITRNSDNYSLMSFSGIGILIGMVILQAITACVWTGNVGFFFFNLIGRAVLNIISVIPGGIICSYELLRSRK